MYKEPRIPPIILPVLAAALLIWGCAAMGKDACRDADWQALGRQDGARGYPPARIGGHQKACAGRGGVPDPAAYEAGRQTGLNAWCDPQNGYRLGLGGNRYNGVCPEQLEAPFVEAVGRGRAVHGYEKQVKNARQELEAMRAELDAMDGELRALEAERTGARATPRRRMQLLKTIRDMEAHRTRFLNDIHDMEDQIADMQANLKRMKASSPYR